jgi:hypothetical protein
MFNGQRIDYPWHDSVLNLQRAVLQRLHAPVTLARLEDNELRFKKDEERFGMADMFIGLESAIWSELDHPVDLIDSLRRNLQREHLKTLTRLAVRSPGGIPEDATSLARSSLKRIDSKISSTLKSASLKDATTIAHLEETKARIASALDAQVYKGVE